MPSTTRRSLLQACVGVAAVGAGCGDSEFDDPPTTTASRGHEPFDAEVERIRHDGGPIVYQTDREGDEESDETRGTPPEDVSPFLVTNADDREALEYRAQADGWKAILNFIDGTDLSRNALFVLQEEIGECYIHRLVTARKDEDDSVDLDFCQQLRPATVACERNSRVMEVLVVRLPFALETVRGYSIGVGSDCRFPPTEGEP